MAQATITVCDSCEKAATQIPVESVSLTVTVKAKTKDDKDVEKTFTFDSHMKDRCIWNNMRKVRATVTESLEKAFPKSVADDESESTEKDDKK